MMNNSGLFLLFNLIICCITNANAEDNGHRKGTFYLGAGYNLDWFSKSDIHFVDRTGPYYDFTIHKARATDRPGLKRIFHEDITIPQYSFRFGYYFNDKNNLGVELNYDHAKYVIPDNQYVHITGTINEKYIDQDTLITNSWLAYEHTNGANFCMFNLLKRIYIIPSPGFRHQLSGIIKTGGGFVLPRTDVTIFGVRRNDTYHVAGYVFGIDAGLRFEFLRYLYLETGWKGVFANYRKVYLPGDGRANHHFFAAEYIFTTGFQF